MQRLRGSFSAIPFEQAANGMRPFLRLHIARQKAKLHRLQRNGLTPAGDKATLRSLVEAAISGSIPRKR
jgi:hypothetical protein